MPIDIQHRLDAIQAKASLLVDRYKAEKQSKEKAMLTIAEQKQQIQRLQSRVVELTREVEILKTARLTAPTREDVERSRALLSSLVRDIDRCIADLTE